MPTADDHVGIIVIHEADGDEATAQLADSSQPMRSIKHNPGLPIDDNRVLETSIRGQSCNESVEMALQNLLVKKQGVYFFKGDLKSDAGMKNSEPHLKPEPSMTITQLLS